MHPPGGIGFLCGSHALLSGIEFRSVARPADSTALHAIGDFGRVHVRRRGGSCDLGAAYWSLSDSTRLL